MKNILLLITLFSLSLFVISCGGETKNKPATKVATAPAAKKEYKNVKPLDSVDKGIMQRLWEECDYTDYIFHNLPFSMSQDEQTSIRSNINYISIEPSPWIPVGCKPMARQMFHVKGEIVVEADVYFSDECKFFVFVHKEKPYAANMMSQAGIDFFTQSINSAMNARK